MIDPIIVKLNNDIGASRELIRMLAECPTFKIRSHLLIPELHVENFVPQPKWFIDSKWFDIPEEVHNDVLLLTGIPNVCMYTVHAQRDVMKAAVRAASDKIKILSVLLLTSMGERELSEYYNWNDSMDDFILRSLDRALECGVHGTICSAQEVSLIKKRVPDDFLIVVPGTRSEYMNKHDHVRSGTPKQAIGDGASHIVIGRQILHSPNPAAEYHRILDEISH